MPVCCTGKVARASSETAFVAAEPGPGTVALGGEWWFHTGDDLAWASPDFDDSAWEKSDISRPWGAQGHWACAGRAWYRRLIEVKGATDDASDLALYIPQTACAYEVYWNGRRIGATDGMPAPVMLNESTPQVFSLPRRAGFSRIHHAIGFHHVGRRIWVCGGASRRKSRGDFQPGGQRARIRHQ